MSTQNVQQNVAFLQVLSIKDCELWHMKDSYSSCCSTGALQILYSDKLDLFLLKLNEFCWVLGKELEVIGIFSEKENWHSYMLPSTHGFYMVKITDASEALISNFETILSNTSQFFRKSGLEQRLGSYQQGEPRGNSFFEKFRNYFTQTLGVILPKHKETHPNQFLIRNFEQLKSVDSHSVAVVDIPEEKLKDLREELGEIKLNHQDSAHWKDIREHGTEQNQNLGSVHQGREQQHIAGTGLTSQSMGTESDEERRRREIEKLDTDKITLRNQRSSSFHDARECDKVDTADSKSCQDQQHVVGTENQRLPAYEVQKSKDELETGFEQCAVNLHSEKTPSLTYLDENAFTSGLLAKKAKVDEAAERKVDKDDEFIDRPFSYQLPDYGFMSLPRIPPSGSYGDFGNQHSPLLKTKEKEAEKDKEKEPEKIKDKPLASIDESSEMTSKPLVSEVVQSDAGKETRQRPAKDSTGGIRESNIDPLGVEEMSQKTTTKKKSKFHQEGKENVGLS